MDNEQPEVRVIRSTRRKKTVQARFDKGVLEVRIPAWMSVQEEREVVERMRLKAQKKRKSAGATDAELCQRAQGLNRKFLAGRANFTAIRWVSNQHSRWGSCSPETGDIRLSDRLQLVPDYVLDSVIVHELVHTFIPGHGPDFWRWADLAPQAERAKGYLEAYQRFGLGT